MLKTVQYCIVLYVLSAFTTASLATHCAMKGTMCDASDAEDAENWVTKI